MATARAASTGTLAIRAQRLGRIFRRGRDLVSPRAKAPLATTAESGTPGATAARHPRLGSDRVWHVDTTLVRLLDGTRAHVHAVIDNFSRRIFAWRAAERFHPTNTLAVLVEAGSRLAPEHVPPTVLGDGGVENRTAAVDELIESGVVRREFAQIEINCSNSLIEAWWRSLKHQWLYLNALDRVAAVCRLVRFYVEEHNARLPHSAFRGQTPDEVYFGTGDGVPEALEARRRAARAARLERNRAVTCGSCQPDVGG